jgi:hypothetical protein
MIPDNQSKNIEYPIVDTDKTKPISSDTFIKGHERVSTGYIKQD